VGVSSLRRNKKDCRWRIRQIPRELHKNNEGREAGYKKMLQPSIDKTKRMQSEGLHHWRGKTFSARDEKRKLLDGGVGNFLEKEIKKATTGENRGKTFVGL